MAKIMIDAGHGGTDSGATKNKRFEKNDTLKMALAVGKMLTNAGHQVHYTRTTDKTVGLSERSALENKGDYDFFISFHRDSFTNTSANGVTVFTYTENSSAINVANKISDAIIEAGLFFDRKVKHANFHVLRETKAPAVLIECGFISNDGDNAKFDKHFDAICKAIAQAICDVYGGTIPKPAPPKPTIMYRVRKTWGDVKSQVSAFINKDSAIESAKKAGSEYEVYDENGKIVWQHEAPKVLHRVIVNGKNVIALTGLEKCIAHAKEKYSKEKVEIQEVESGKIVWQQAKVVSKYVNLSPQDATWRVYKVGGAYTVGSEIGKLTPKTFGGLSYKIEKELGNNMYVITTGAYGTVAIWCDDITSNAKY